MDSFFHLAQVRPIMWRPQANTHSEFSCTQFCHKLSLRPREGNLIHQNLSFSSVKLVSKSNLLEKHFSFPFCNRYFRKKRTVGSAHSKLLLLWGLCILMPQRASPSGPSDASISSSAVGLGHRDMRSLSL